MCRDTAVSVVSVLHANSVHLCNKQGNMKIVCLVVEPPCDAVVPVCNCDIDRSNSLLSSGNHSKSNLAQWLSMKHCAR